jgi:acyl-CoA thioesterase-1
VLPAGLRRLGAILVAAVMMIGAGGSAARAQADEPIRLMAFGDSLVAGFGVAANNAFPAQLQAALRAEGYSVEVLNAGVSGETTAGGAARIDWALGDDPDMVLLELGANDALRGIDPEEARDNLDYILQRLKEERIPVLLAGMRAPANWGPDYVAAFNRIYPELAEEYGVTLYPFFLEDVATDPRLNQGDGIHPNARGVAVIVENILPYVIRVLEESGLAGDASGEGTESE